MKRNLHKLTTDLFDVLVIGGGITGACIAHDAALRGLSVALIEKDDFGGCTSSASSKLLHGGIRYLPKGQVWKVRESAREQAIFQHLAPHLTSWLPFLIPTDKSSVTKGRLALRAAMQVYRLCCTGLSRLIHDTGKKIPSARFLSPQSVLTKIPMLSSLKGLSGAQVLYESHMYSSERMTLAFVKTAVANGARAANYLLVRQLLTDGNQVTGIRVQDRLTDEEFEIKSRLIINSAGPFVQQVNASVPALKLQHPLTGFSRGVHLVTRQVEPEFALALMSAKKTEGMITRGGRHFFIIPWRGCSLIGTTNVPLSGSLEDIRVTQKDITDFLDDINGALPDLKLEFTDVRYAFTGIYPLIAEQVKSDTYQGTGEYQIIDHRQKEGIDGIMTALGAKFTTARKVAEQAIDLAMKKLDKDDPGSATVTTQLVEGQLADIKKHYQQCRTRYSKILDHDAVSHLIRYHGREAEQLIKDGAENNLLDKITPDRSTLEIEVDYAVRHEMACTLEDIVFRRTGLGTIGFPGNEALERCAEIMGNLLDWDNQEKLRQIATVAARYKYE